MKPTRTRQSPGILTSYRLSTQTLSALLIVLLLTAASFVIADSTDEHTVCHTPNNQIYKKIKLDQKYNCGPKSDVWLQLKAENKIKSVTLAVQTTTQEGTHPIFMLIQLLDSDIPKSLTRVSDYAGVEEKIWYENKSIRAAIESKIKSKKTSYTRIGDPERIFITSIHIDKVPSKGLFSRIVSVIFSEIKQIYQTTFKRKVKSEPVSEAKK